MSSLSCVLLPVILLFVYFTEAWGIVCTKEELFDTTPLICPGPYDPKDKVYCCGPKKRRFCCSYTEYASAINTIGIIVGVLVTALVVVVIIVVVSCFCCSCCLLARKCNRRSAAYAGSGSATTTTTTAHYTAQPTYPNIQPYPGAYPPPPQHFQQQYPQQQFTQEHFQFQHYPPYPPPGGYPPPAGNPPPYPINDQPPYNPSFK